jgi:hypothetical protein
MSKSLMTKGNTMTSTAMSNSMNTGNSFMGMKEEHPLPEEKEVSLMELVSKQDPTTLYKGMVKIGEGYYQSFKTSNKQQSSWRSVCSNCP